MMTGTHPDPFEIEQFDNVTVVRFTRRTILDQETITAIGNRLLDLVPEGSKRKLVLDFARVESLTTAMLGKLVNLHLHIDWAGGRLAFCNVDPFLMQIFTLCKVPQTIPVVADCATAVRLLLNEDGSPVA
jgi:anti-anti-sigma regulatory factor